MSENTRTFVDPSDDRLNEAIATFEEARDAGLTPDPLDWLSRYSDVADRLRAYFVNVQNLVGLTQPDGARLPDIGEFADYDNLELISCGGMGVVYKARRKSTQQTVALKLIRPDLLHGLSPEQRRKILERFITEAQVAALLEHENIVKVYDVGEGSGRPYYSMRYVQGKSLSGLLQDGPMPPKQAAAYIEQIARAVHMAHQHGIIHRDLKPNNILVDAQTDRPLVADFGLAMLMDRNQDPARTREIVGAPSYMSPEQAQDAALVTTATDVYGLGATLYSLLTGQPPFHGDTAVSTLKKVIEEEPPPPRKFNSAVPRDLQTICLVCLRKDPHKRYASAEALANDLSRYRDGRPIHGRLTPRWERAWMWMKRKPLVASLYGALAAVVLLSLSIGLWQWRETVNALHDAENNLYGLRVFQAERELSTGSSDEGENLLDLCPREMRDWEWHYLKRWCQGDLHKLAGNNRPIAAFAISPDGKILITGDDQGAVQAWGGNQFQQELELDRHPREAVNIHFSSKSNVCAVAFKDKTVKIWEVSTIDKKQPPKVLPDVGELVAVSPDGKLVATAGPGNDVWVWDVQNADVKKAFGPFNHEAHVNCLTFSADGGFLVTAGYGTRRLRVWELKSNKERSGFTLPELKIKINSVAFSPDGKWIALSDGTSLGLWPWNPKGIDNNETRLHGGFKGHFASIAFSADGKYLAGTTQAGSVTIWEVEGKGVVFTAKRHRTMIPLVAFVPENGDPALIYPRGDNLFLERWKPPAGRPICDLPLPGAISTRMRQVAFDSVNARVAISSSDGKIFLANLATSRSRPQLVKELPMGSVKRPLDALAFSGDGSRLAGVTEHGTLLVWNLADDELLFEQATQLTLVSSIAFDGNGKRVAIASKNKEIQVWDCVSRQKILSLSAPTLVQSVAFNASGKYLAFGADGGVLKIWDVDKDALVADLLGHRSLVLSLAFCPNAPEEKLVSGSWDGTVKLWGIRSKKCLQTLAGHTSMISNVSFHPKGRRIASAGKDGVVHVWDAASGRLELTLRDQKAGVTGMSFCQRDGALLAAASLGGAIKVWNAMELPSP